MTWTPRDELFLRTARRYKFLLASQYRRWLVPHDKDGSITRQELRKLEAARLLRRLRTEVAGPLSTTAPTWVITEAGACLLAAKTGDASLLLDAVPNTNDWQNNGHKVALSELVHTIDAAFAAQDYAALGPLYFEYDIINPEAKEPERRYRLFTTEEIGGRRIVCAPDAAFEVIVGKHRRAYYVELERGSDTPKRVAAKKAPGYGILQRHFQKHFPEAQHWRVVFVWPNAGLRDAARQAVKPALAENWLFVALPDITDHFLHEPVLYDLAGPRPFIKPPVNPVAAPAPYKKAE